MADEPRYRRLRWVVEQSGKPRRSVLRWLKRLQRRTRVALLIRSADGGPWFVDVSALKNMSEAA